MRLVILRCPTSRILWNGQLNPSPTWAWSSDRTDMQKLFASRTDESLLVMGVTVVLAGNDDVLVVLKTCMKKPH